MHSTFWDFLFVFLRVEIIKKFFLLLRSRSAEMSAMRKSFRRIRYNNIEAINAYYTCKIKKHTQKTYQHRRIICYSSFQVVKKQARDFFFPFFVFKLNDMTMRNKKIHGWLGFDQQKKNPIRCSAGALHRALVSSIDRKKRAFMFYVFFSFFF